MQVYDISWPIMPTMTAYKNKQVVSIKETRTFEQDAVRESIITLGSHTGTHIDAPSHFIADGKTIDQLGHLVGVGPAVVIDCTGVDMITQTVLSTHALTPDTFILFKTDNSMHAVTDDFNTTFVALDSSAAQMLVNAGVRGVGIDYLGIERNQPDHATHNILLRAGCSIIEGLRLRDVPAGNYFLCCLPLALVGCDGAPARAVLFSH